MTQPNDKPALPLVVQELLADGSDRREALRRLSAGVLSASPLALIACGGDESTKKAGAVAQKPESASFSIGSNSSDSVNGFYSTRLYQAENTNKSADNWSLVSGNPTDVSMVLFQPTSVPAAVNVVLPPGRTVQSVDDVRLLVSQAASLPETVPCSIYAIAQSHVQGQETFTTAANGQPWSSGAGPARGNQLGTILLGGSAGIKESSNLRALFTDAQAVANGFVIVSDGGSGGGLGTGGWEFLANEWQPFTLPADARVRYGAGSTWIERNLPAGQAFCTNAFFGEDPLFGTVKRCEVLRSGGVGDNGGSSAYIVLWQSNHTDGQRPKLVVTYTHDGVGAPPPAPTPPAPPPPAPPPPPPAPPPPAPAPPAASAFRVGSNQGFQDWMPSQFTDIVENSRGFMTQDRYDDNGALPRDAQGWPLAASRLVCWTSTGQRDFPVNQAFKGSYNGVGEIRSEIGGVEIRNLVRSGNNVTFDVVVTSWPLNGVFSFSGPVRDVTILVPGSNGNYLRPEAVQQGGLYWVHRFMQAAGILDTNREISWGSRKPPGYKYGYKPWESVFQWLMGYVNAPGSRTRAGWFDVPRMADANYQIQLAQLAAASLPSNVIQYWGLGNELWNNIYQSAFGPQGMGQPYNRASNPNDPDYARINNPPVDAFERMNRLMALEFARMAKRFLSVFGQSAFGTRLRPVYETQHANPWMIETPLAWLSRPEQVAEFGPVNSYCWSISGAPYAAGEWFEMDEVRSPTPESILAGLRSGYSYDMPFALAQADRWIEIKNQFGIAEVTAYEGIAPHTDGPAPTSNSVNKYGAHIHPDMRRLIVDFGTGLRNRGYGACCYFVGYSGAHNPQDLNSLWTVNQAFNEDSPKMLGVKDLIALSGV